MAGFLKYPQILLRRRTGRLSGYQNTAKPWPYGRIAPRRNSLVKILVECLPPGNFYIQTRAMGCNLLKKRD